MGIVVSLAMLLALFMMCFASTCNQPKYQALTKVGMSFVVLLGVWNAAWYGIPNIASFWGMTALLSGVFMLFAGQIIYLEVTQSAITRHARYFDFKLVTTMVLGLYFLLYAITIIQMNLEMPIIN